MALSAIDRKLLERCLGRKPRAWEDFVDRFMGLVIHVVNHTCQARSIRLAHEDRDDLAAEVFLALVKDDFAVLRHFRGESSLATYLTVVARRVVVRELLKMKPAVLGEPIGGHSIAGHSIGGQPTNGHGLDGLADERSAFEQRITDREEVERMLDQLEGTEAQVVRLYHLEGKSYLEISKAVGLAENSIGPTLSRARRKLRRLGPDPATH